MEYAKTLSGLASDKTMEEIMDRSQDVLPVYDGMRERWNRGLFERNPTPSYSVHGEYKGSNLDMASMLNVLADREAVINLPEYKPIGPGKRNEKEWIISKENRHGKILGLIAKKDAFSFSVRIEDQNVVDLEKNKTGKYRNFLITNLDGNFYEGSRTIEIPPYQDIVKFADKYGIALRNYDMRLKDRINGSKVIRFENFVQPNLWQAFFSGDYIKTKALEKRLEDEGRYYRASAAKIKERLGIDEKAGEYELFSWPGKNTWTVPKELETLQAEIDTPELEGRYAPVRCTKEGFEKATKMANTISYSMLPKLRFNTRAVELAFYKNGADGALNPGWSVPDIERSYVLPGKRIEWNKMAIDNNLALRYRFLTRTERVNPE